MSDGHKWLPSIPWTMKQSSLTKWSFPQGLFSSRSCILWDKDGNPYLLRDCNVGAILTSTIGNKVDQSSLTLHQASHIVTGWQWLPREFQDSHRDPVRPVMVVSKTSPNWMWHKVTQMAGTIAPAPVHLVWQQYQPVDLGFGWIDPRCKQPPSVPGIKLSLLSPIGLLVSGKLTVVTPLYHMLLEVS